MHQVPEPEHIWKLNSGITVSAYRWLSTQWFLAISRDNMCFLRNVCGYCGFRNHVFGLDDIIQTGRAHEITTNLATVRVLIIRGCIGVYLRADK